tara:strand:- start:244 stop:417 length:174 start_codon:yes stop_codon:yes gene_type:complete
MDIQMRKSVIGIVILGLVIMALLIVLIIATSCTVKSKPSPREISDEDIDRSVTENYQ